MIELDQMKQKLMSYEGPLSEVKASLDLDSKQKRIEELEMEMEAPGFWDDPDYSNKRMKELKNLKDFTTYENEQVLDTWVNEDGVEFKNVTKVLEKQNMKVSFRKSKQSWMILWRSWRMCASALFFQANMTKITLF